MIIVYAIGTVMAGLTAQVIVIGIYEDWKNNFK